MLKTMTEKHTDLSPCKGALGIPNDFIIGEAAGEGDCFFDSVAQGMNQLSIPGGPFSVKSLRCACSDYASINEDSVYDSQSGKTWHQVISEDAVARGYASNSRHEHSQFESYLAHIQLTVEERADSNLVAIWGRPDIEGRMLCQKYGIKLHVIEKLNADSQELTGCQLVGSSGSVAVEEDSSLYSEPQMIHILNEGQCHFVPVLRNTSVCSKPKKKRSHSSLLEGVQSQDNPMDGSALHLVKSVAASLQQVSLLSAQPGHLEQGEEKTKSASEGKTYQAVGDPYLKECSLNDKSAWRAVAKKEDADFKILMITNSPTVSAALDFMKQAGFCETFNQASHWFFIVVRVDDCNESPSHAVEYLAAVFDTEKPVIIQWDFMCSAEHLVFFRQANQHAFTQLQMNSDSLLTTEDELTAQLSKEGSFQLPLLVNALKLGIGGQFKGDALDLLGVSFGVKQEINNWRLIDYAARDDDSLSLQFLLLADWDLAYRNGRGRRTLEIAAEYAGPQSLAALLNLPITSSAEELFLTDSKKGLLALTDGHGDTPLLIAAQNGRPETLQYLIWCGADMHCHRPGNENVTAIALAWDKEHYENVQVLLEADSPFPENFDLNVLEGSENTTALMKQVEARQSFHQAIKEGSQHGVKAFIKRHPRLKWAYDPSNKSALLTALEAGQYEIYALLQSEGFSAGKNEDLSVVIQGLTSEQKQRLTEAQLNYFGRQDNSHIIYLLSKSRLGFGQDRKNFESIQGLYEQLDAIPEISTILKVVEQSEKIEIIFDFNRDSIIDLDPTQSSNTSGACDYRAGCIYVGAKDQTKLLGTLAHELTHLAMQVCYNNCCNPYEVLDEQRKRTFGKIVEQYCDKTGVDPIIQRVFALYYQSVWPAELIVRVPHLMAHYKEEQGKQLLTQQAPELFHFYEQETQGDLRNFIENAAAVKARHQIQRVNDLLGKLDEIKQSKIVLNDKCLLNNDVTNCQTILILSSPLPQLTFLNLYQVLRRKQLSVSDIKSGYIFASAKEFENQEKARTIFEAFQSVSYPTLIIDCSCEYEKSETDLWSTLNSFSEKRRIIFIAVPDVAQSLECKLKKHQAKIVHDTEYGWCDLTPASQNELLKNKVCFQGCNMSLSELISAESPVTKFLPLPDLLADKTLEIGKHVLTFTADGFVEKYYIDRTFNHQVGIKQDIFKKEQFPDILATNEQQFKKCCQGNPKRNVHWLQKEKSGKLIWQQSQGSLKALHEYIETQHPQVYPPQKFLHQAQSQKVMLIADMAGMGKTTVLTHLAKQIRQKYPTYWVVSIDLNCHIDALEDQVKQKIGTNEFLSEKLLTFCSPFEKELFKHCLHGLEEKTKVVLMFDGFDEICPNYKETVLDLLQAVNPLKQPWIQQLWVTTRPHLREVLEDHLQQLCYTLEPFSKDDQVGFLTKFWHQSLKLQEGNQLQLEKYAMKLIEKLAQSISDKEKEFTGIPLQTRMLAEAFHEEVETFCLSHISEPELHEKLCLVDLYRKFIKTKLNIFQHRGEIARQQNADILSTDISVTKNHQKLALEILFPELQGTVLKLEESSLLSSEAVAWIGIVQYVNDKPHFTHRTFAEYYVAYFLVTQFTQKTCSTLKEQKSLLYKILQEEAYKVIRFFVDGLLSKAEPSEVNLKQFGKQIYSVWKVKQKHLRRVELITVLHQAAREGNAHIIGFLFSSLKAAGHSVAINNLLQCKEGYSKKNAWHLAAAGGHIKTLEKLLWWAREVQLNLKDDLLLAKDEDGETAWHIAAQYGYKEILETLWGWGREVQLNLKDDLLLAKDMYGQTAWHIAAWYGNKEILETLWGWAREVQHNLKGDLLVAKDEDGETAWNIAAQGGYKEILETLWGWAREVQLNLKDDLLLAKDMYGQTAWHIAAQDGKKEILETLWGWGREVQLNKDDLLLTKDKDGQTAWHIAARHGKKEILETLWGWAREVQLNLKDDLLLAKDMYGQTAWHIAAWRGEKESLETLWGWAREVQLNLKDDLLLAKDEDGQTAWHIASQWGNEEILETLWGLAGEVQLNKDDLLLVKDKNGLSVWHIAAEYGFV